MAENNVPKNIQDNMDVVIVIDKEKLPEDVRKLLEENLPKDVQDKVLNMLNVKSPPIIKDKQDNPVPDNKIPGNIDNKSDDKSKDNRLFAIQTGTVVGNIYTDGIYKREEGSYIKKNDIKNSKMLLKDLGGCC